MNITNTNCSAIHESIISPRNKKYQLYFLFEVITGRVFYIGVTCQTLSTRLKSHVYSCQRKTSNGDWYYAYYHARKLRKMCADGVEFGIEKLLEFETQEEAWEAERKYIEWCTSMGFKLSNTTKGGNGSVSGRVCLEQTKEKLREANLGSKNPRYGTVPSEESNKRQSRVMKGRVPEHWKDPQRKATVIAKISKTKINLAQNKGSNNPNFGNTGAKNVLSRKVNQFDLEGNLLCEFGGIKEAARAVGRDSKGIRMCLAGKRKTSAGYVWKYPNS